MPLKIGVKFYPEHIENILKAGIDLSGFSGKADFAEIMARDGLDTGLLEGLGVPVTVHTNHKKCNACDPAAAEASREALRFAIETADRLGSRVIVVHGGWLTSPDCSLDNAISLLKEFPDRRIHIENLPYREKGFGFIGRTPGEIKGLMDGTGCRFCLDFSHAAATAYGLGRDYPEFVRSFLPLKPSYFHMHDSLIKTELCKHMHLGDGELDIGAFKGMLPEDAWVCLETLGESENTMDRCFRDIECLRKL